METNAYMDVVPYYSSHPTEYFAAIYIPVMIWMALSLIFVIIMFKKYTFGDWTKENPNPCDGETFNMPRGTFRGILTLSLLFITVVIELANVKIIGLEQEFTEFMAAFQMMIAFYFGAKVMHHINSVDKSKTKALAEAAEATALGTASSTFTSCESGVTTVDNSYFEEEGALG
ncbi:MAG: hypothetical protein MJ211_06600 [Bacteroidales bacterium]|nr:hypothetical protein [Bacteroidales bacterium]